MKFVCQKNSLLKGINTVLKAVSTRTTNEILKCIIFETLENQVQLTANDQSLGIEKKIEAAITDEGTVAIDAFLISNLVRRLPDDSIIIESNEKGLAKVTCGQSVFEIPCMDVEDFIKLPEIEVKGTVKVSQYTVYEMIEKVIFAAAVSDTKVTMTGVYLEILDNYIRMTALDGHKVAIRKSELKENFGKFNAIVPQKTLNDLKNIIKGEQDEEMTISFSKNHIVFEFEDTRVVSRIIDGEYFKIDKLLNCNFNTKLDINKKNLLDTIDRANLFVDESNKKPLIINITDENMEFSLKSVRGTMEDQIEIEKEGENLKIAFDSKLLMDVVRVIEDEKITLYLLDKKSPCTIKTDDGRYVYVALPVSFVEE